MLGTIWLVCVFRADCNKVPQCFLALYFLNMICFWTNYYRSMSSDNSCN